MSKDVLFEIGLEELPARFIDDAEKQLTEKTKAWLKKSRIPYESITSFSTPRRLTVVVQDVAEEQTTIKEEVRGPAKKIALDDKDNWTKAAIGFTKGQGQSIEDIYTKDIKGTPYIFVEKHIVGKQTKDLLQSFKTVIESIKFPEQMSWGEETLRYARPIRWLVALYEDRVISFNVANVQTSNITYGHRFLGDKIELTSPSDYKEQLRKNFVITNKEERKKIILESIKEIEASNDFQVEVDTDLLNEICNLVEYPTAFVGQFQEAFLKLPSEALITSMKEHQRYFPVQSKDKELLPYFIGVRNGNDQALENVVAGNEKVLRARLSDAEFFYEEDLKQSVEINLEKLKRVVFQEKIGTISEKSNRVSQITKLLAEKLNVDKATTDKAVRAAKISKFDLMTYMVNEFPELQGIMGEKYALHFGEDEVVGTAIREQYLPKLANGALPKSLVGAILSVADKLDTIVGCISVGLIPTGSQDPYGLRRQAIGIIRILKDRDWDITLESLLQITLDYFPIDKDEKESIVKKLNDFFALRATYLLIERGIEQDVIQAVLQRGIGNFTYASEKAMLLSEKRNDKQFKFVQEALVRVMNLSTVPEKIHVDESLFETSSEQLLFDKYKTVYKEYTAQAEQYKARGALSEIERLAKPIHLFFEHNMVMADDEALRNNRLSLLNKIASLVKDFADLSLIEWNQHG